MAALNLAEVLRHHADRYPEKPALRWAGETITYGELWRRTREKAAGLHARGLGQGDVVAVLLYNCPEFLELMFAAGYLGAIFMPINFRLAADEVSYIGSHSGAKLFVSERELAHLVLPDQLPCSSYVSVGAGVDGWIPYAEVAGPNPPEMAAVQPDDSLRLMYTSGTTARPKGVMISHANLYWKNAAHVVEFSITTDDVGLACGPLYHVGALDLTTTTLLYAGGSVNLLRTFDATAVLDAVEQQRITTIWLAPTMVNQLVNHPSVEQRDLSSVRLIIDGGEKMPLPLIQRVLACFPNAWFADAYGLTETVSGDTFLDKGRVLEKLGSVGKPCLHLDVAIWDDDNTPLPAGTPGEIVLRGPKVFKGYWRDEAATAAAFAGGWFHTGDIGVVDEDGYLFIIDRKKDIIISGGENVASLEVERVLYEHPAVLEAAVVGRPDPRWAEVPVAFIAIRPGETVTEADLIAHCTAKLAKFKVPKQVTFIDQLPRNPSGKVLKRELRDRAKV